jgi:adenine phosphoribosyltransferase
LSPTLGHRLREVIRDIPDFPQPGILFKDITPVLADPELLLAVITALGDAFADQRVDRVAAIESRGFIFGAPLALRFGCGFAPVRKLGKLPHSTMRVDYSLEYGAGALEAHVDAIEPGENVLIVDDVLATGGTAAAAVQLVRRLGGEPLGVACLIELAFLDGRAQLADVPIHSLVQYDG